MEVDAANGRLWHVHHGTDTTGGASFVAVSEGASQTAAFDVHTVGGNFGGIFPCITVDDDGNTYAVIASAATRLRLVVHPRLRQRSQAGGKPGTTWHGPYRVSTPPAQTTVMAEMCPPRRTTWPSSTTAPAAPDRRTRSLWARSGNVYLAHSKNALCDGILHCPQPYFTQQVVNRRTVHTQDICTQGTGCSGNRDLLDMIDVGVDGDGRLYATWSDDHNDDYSQELGGRVNIRVAKEQSGPSLVKGHAPFADPEPTNPMADVSGDATWPNFIDTTPKGGEPARFLDITKVALDDYACDIDIHLTLGDVVNLGKGITTVDPAGRPRALRGALRVRRPRVLRRLRAPLDGRRARVHGRDQPG